jgi:hypothetical protein
MGRHNYTQWCLCKGNHVLYPKDPPMHNWQNHARSIVLNSSALYCSVLNGTFPYRVFLIITVLSFIVCFTVLCNILVYCADLNCNVQYCTVLCWPALYITKLGSTVHCYNEKIPSVQPSIYCRKLQRIQWENPCFLSLSNCCLDYVSGRTTIR